MSEGNPLEYRGVVERAIFGRSRFGPGPNARSGGVTVRLERSPGTTLSCDNRHDCLSAVRCASAEAWNRMATDISLREVIETLEMQGENCLSYLDPDTGKIVTATEEVRRLAEEPEESQDDLPEWQRETVRKVRDVLASDRCLRLPDRFEIDEWFIVDEFAQTQHSERVRQELLEAIHGAGAFRMFRSTIRPGHRKKLVSLPRGSAGRNRTRLARGARAFV
jgi:hypothetical protein